MPVSHGPRGRPLSATAVPRVLRDATGCRHSVLELHGVAQCRRCDRYFVEVELEDGTIALRVDLSKYPQGGDS